jgi:exopolyphosphatase/guanosine-5'-triphosphate,3'-diphosphate pyrophosphatase
MTIAVIDLGTNTFNLLIAEADQNRKLHVRHRNEIGIKLGEGGINKKIITPEAFRRGIDGVSTQLQKARKWNPDKILVVATSGIRSSENGQQFIEQVREQFNLEVKVITGDQEAMLIYRGVRQAMPMDEKPVMIVDIGGGSIEFILANKHQVFWKQSLDIGMARILERFSPSDPITRDQIQQVEDYFEEKLKPLYEPVNHYQPVKLVGCAGTFETVRSILTAEGAVNKPSNDQPWFEIPYPLFRQLHGRLLCSTSQERQNIKGLELFRVDMIVLASIFANFIMLKFGFDRLVQSDYSIKEGAADEWMNP